MIETFFHLAGTDILDLGQIADGYRSHFPHSRYTTLDVNPLSGADVIADAHQLPFQDHTFDTVISDCLLEHCHSPHLVVQEIHRVLKPDGWVILSTPFIHPYHGGTNCGTHCPDYYRFTKDGLAFLFKDFETHLHSDGGFLYALGSFFPRLAPLFHFADRFYPRGQSRHMYIVVARKI